MSMFRVSPLPRLLRSQLTQTPLRSSRSLCTSTRTETARSKSFLNSYRLAVGLSLPVLAIALPLASSQSTALKCESDRSYAQTGALPVEELPLPTSILDLQTLSFSTASGICVGIFLVKGAKFIGSSDFFVLFEFRQDCRTVADVTVQRLHWEESSSDCSTCRLVRSSR